MPGEGELGERASLVDLGRGAKIRFSAVKWLEFNHSTTICAKMFLRFPNTHQVSVPSPPARNSRGSIDPSIDAHARAVLLAVAPQFPKLRTGERPGCGGAVTPGPRGSPKNPEEP